MSEETDNLDSQLSEAASEVSEWRSLLDNPGWKRLEREMEIQQNIRKEVVTETPLGSKFAVFAQEFFKGQFSGIKSVMTHPRTRMEEAKRQVAIIEAQLETEYETEKRIARAAKSRVDTDDHFGQ